MSIASMFNHVARTPRVRRGLAASAIVLAAGGCILYRAHARPNVSPHHVGPTDVVPAFTLTNATNASSFAGAGAHGQLALSHAKVLAGADRQVFAVLTMTADKSDIAKERAPLSIAVVLDTSGSMEGEKIQQAKDSVLRLIGDMRDDDEIAVVRYSDDSEVVQSLAKVGTVREMLASKIRALRAGGGTAIPKGLSRGSQSLAEAGRGRVKRIVLVSDGLDSTRAQAEQLASTSFESGVVVSSMGIGLDFDESYMGAVARAGHGNFAFVQDGAALASFLKRELQETASTTIEKATAKLTLPKGVRFVRAMGADATTSGDQVELKLGSLFAGDERRVVVELAANVDAGDARAIGGAVTWSRVGANAAQAPLTALSLTGSDDAAAVRASLDGAVLANATSVLASTRALEATEAYNHGEQKKAQDLMQQNQHDLAEVAAAAPPPMARALTLQKEDYQASAQAMATAAPTSDRGKLAAKQAAQKDLDNMARPSSTWGSGSSPASSPKPTATPTVAPTSTNVSGP